MFMRLPQRRRCRRDCAEEEETNRVMTGMDPGPSYERCFDGVDENECDYDSVDYWFQTDVPPDEEEQQQQETIQSPPPEEPTYSYVECIVVDADPQDDLALLVPRNQSKGMMHEEIVLERLRERYDCDLERCGCLVKNCGRFFDSYAQLAFHLSYSHRDIKNPGSSGECLVCGITLKQAKGLITHLSSKHRVLASEHHQLCLQQRLAEPKAYAPALPPRKRQRKPKQQPLVEENHRAAAGATTICNNAKFIASDGAYYVVRGEQIREDENNGEVYVEEVMQEEEDEDDGPPVLNPQDDMYNNYY